MSTKRWKFKQINKVHWEKHLQSAEGPGGARWPRDSVQFSLPGVQGSTSTSWNLFREDTSGRSISSWTSSSSRSRYFPLCMVKLRLCAGPSSSSCRISSMNARRGCTSPISWGTSEASGGPSTAVVICIHLGGRTLTDCRSSPTMSRACGRRGCKAEQEKLVSQCANRQQIFTRRFRQLTLLLQITSVV